MPVQQRSGDGTSWGDIPYATQRVVREVDMRSSHCPSPLLEMIRLVSECAVGDTVSVIAADRAAGDDITDWARRVRQPVAVEQLEGGGRRYLVTKVR
jgi:TusA-related sulfurtransferase